MSVQCPTFARSLQTLNQTELVREASDDDAEQEPQCGAVSHIQSNWNNSADDLETPCTVCVDQRGDRGDLVGITRDDF